MRKYIIFLFFLSFLKFNLTLAQISISGSVVDTAQNSVENVIIEIFENGDWFNSYRTKTDASGNFYFNGIISDIGENNRYIPENHILLTNYPNPFNPTTIIHFELQKEERIKIIIYDILGREVRNLLDDIQKPGVHQIDWDGKNNFGRPVSAGIYFCRLLTSSNNFEVHKMVFLDGGSFTPSRNNRKLFRSNKKFNVLESEPFRFSIRANSKNINPIEIYDLVCTQDTVINLVATLPFVQSIGSEGGTISTDEFYVNFPTGSLKENTEFKLYTMPVNTSYQDNFVTETFKLDGLTGEFNERIKIGIKYNEPLVNESVIEIGSYQLIPEINDSVISYTPYPAIDSAGFLWVDYPSTDLNLNPSPKFNKGNSAQSSLYEKSLNFTGKTNRKRFETENFHGNFPEYMWQIPILNYLEVAYAKYQTMGFNFQPDDLQVEKGNVIIGFVNPPHKIFPGLSEGEIFGYGQAYIASGIANPTDLYRSLNLSFFWWLFTDDYPFKHRLQAISGMVLFDAIALSYDTRREYDRTAHNCERFWFHRAASSWAGELFTTEENYVAPGFISNELAPFHGMVAGACGREDREIKMHGYGMSSLVKFIMEKAKQEGRFNSLLHNIYIDIFGNNNPAYAVILNMIQPIEIWLTDYYKEYISGNIYDVKSSVFLNASDDDLLKININDNSSSNATILREYPDLSAKLFQFNLNYTETNDYNQLQLKPVYQQITNASPTTVLFGLKNNNLEYISSGTGSIICNIKEAQTNGYNTLLAAVVNHLYNPLTFTDMSEIDLSIKMKEKDSLNFAIVKVKTNATFKYYDETSYDGTYLYNPGSGDARYGTFENGKFESQWLETFGGGSSSGIVKLNVNLQSSPPRIIDFYVRETEITSDIEENLIVGNSVNIPGYKRSFGGYEFYISGSETCSYISNIQNAYQGPGDYAWQLTEFSCDNDSYIQIIIGGD